MEHITIYREPGRYAGWPANYGIWSWGDEIVVGFTAGYHDPAGGFHARDSNRPFVAMQARSLDGGRSWDVAPTPCRTPGGRGLSADEHVQPELWTLAAIEQGLAGAPTPCPGDIDFTQPDFALMCGRTGLKTGSQSWFYTSTDRARTWQGPYCLPQFGFVGTSARTDYLVSGPSTCTLMLTGCQSERRRRPRLLRPHDRWRPDVESALACRPGAIRLRHHARQSAPESDAHLVRGALRRAGHGEHPGTCLD